MTERCPTCGQPLPEQYAIRTADELVAAMNVPPPASGNPKTDRSRDVYESMHGRYCLTYGSGPVAPTAVQEAIRRGLIVPTWPDISQGSWSLPKQAHENRRKWEEYHAKRRSANPQREEGRDAG